MEGVREDMRGPFLVGYWDSRWDTSLEGSILGGGICRGERHDRRVGHGLVH